MMNVFKRFFVMTTAVLAMAFISSSCQSPLQQTQAPGTANDHFVLNSEGGEPCAKGKGRYLLASTFDIALDFMAQLDDNGDIKGTFFQSLLFEGQLVEFLCEVTCYSVDAENGRAWIGGIVLENNSEHPAFQEDLHQPGRDVWFRVLDTGQGSEEPDRSTFLGFEGAAGFPTSESYCEGQPWPDNNERTHPVTSGKIKVKVCD